VSDLSQFGAGVEKHDETSDTPVQGGQDGGRSYPNGRCPTITTDGQRCAAAQSVKPEMDLCATHDRQHDPVTTHDGPKRLIEATSRARWQDLEFKDGRQRAILHRLVGIESEPLPVSEAGLWLPERFRNADRLIVRTPVGTHDLRRTGDGQRDAVYSGASPTAWDPDYLDGEDLSARIRNEECLPTEDRPPRVGLLIEGGRQWWFPIEREDGDADD
jgi:hypothetical protein